MRDRNPYLAHLVLFVVAICVALSFIIYGIVSGNVGLAILQLVFVVFDSIMLGWTICKFVRHRQLVKDMEMLEKALMEIQKQIEIEDGEPFGEFDNENS